MLLGYINYPRPHMTLHANLSCPEIGKMGKVNQRKLKVTSTSLAQTVSLLSGDSFRLGAASSINDLWLELDFGDSQFEEAVARYLFRVLGLRYTPLADSPIKTHC